MYDWYVLGNKISKEKIKKVQPNLLLNRTLAEREWHRRIKEEPEKCAIMKARNRKNYLKRKSEKKVRSINDLSPIEQKIQRERWRQNTQRYQVRKKLPKIQNVFIKIENTDEDEFNSQSDLPFKGNI